MEHSDALVIGAGLVGCAAAWHLASAGASVRLIDAGHMNIGASGQNAGSLHFQIERRFLENGAALAEQASRVVSLSRMAVDDWRGLEAALDADLHVRMDGGLMVAETAEEVALLETKVRHEQAAGLSAKLIDGDTARSIAPYLSRNIIAANFMADEGHADPRSVTPAFAAAARRAGARIENGTRIVALERRTDGFEVTLESAGGQYMLRTNRILAATGAWTAQTGAIANLHLPIFPVALLMNATERTAPFLPHLVQHAGRRLSMKQTHSGNVLIGGGWPSRLSADASGAFDLSVRPQMIPASLTGNLRAAIHTVPAVGDLNLIRSWTGTTAITADQLPLVGEVPRMPGFFVAAGGSAFTLGPTLARLVAQQMIGDNRAEADDALAITAPARFEHLNGFMG